MSVFSKRNFYYLSSALISLLLVLACIPDDMLVPNESDVNVLSMVAATFGGGAAERVLSAPEVTPTDDDLTFDDLHRAPTDQLKISDYFELDEHTASLIDPVSYFFENNLHYNLPRITYRLSSTEHASEG